MGKKQTKKRKKKKENLFKSLLDKPFTILHHLQVYWMTGLLTDLLSVASEYLKQIL